MRLYAFLTLLLVASETVSGQYGFVATYAPRVLLNSQERFLPSSVDFFLPNVQVDINGTAVLGQPSNLSAIDLGFQGSAAQEAASMLTTKQPLGCANCTGPEFLTGEGIDAPVYAIVIPKPALPATDVYYWFFYPFNLGRNVCLADLAVTSEAACPAAPQIFGNHVGDWEHIAIRFDDELQPQSIFLAQHSGGVLYNWSSPYIQLYNDTHPVVFSAMGSHATYNDSGTHEYSSLPVLTDPCDRGLEWDTWENVFEVEYSGNGTYNGDAAWLAWGGGWGNAQEGCDTIVTEVTGTCTLDNGPPGPLFHGGVDGDVLV